MNYGQQKTSLASKSIGISPMSGSTSMANTTVKAKAVPKVSSAMPAHSISSGSNAQTEQMTRTINKTNKVQQTYGMPGKK